MAVSKFTKSKISLDKIVTIFRAKTELWMERFAIQQMQISNFQIGITVRGHNMSIITFCAHLIFGTHCLLRFLICWNCHVTGTYRGPFEDFFERIYRHLGNFVFVCARIIAAGHMDCTKQHRCLFYSLTSGY